MTDPHKLITQLQSSNFYGSLEMTFRHGQITLLKKVETFVTDGPGKSNQNERNSNEQHHSFRRTSNFANQS